MRRLIPFFIVSLILVVFVGGTWFARGTFDRLFMMEGCVHVVNVSGEELNVELTFPSSVKKSVTLRSLGSETFRVRRTGEGSISVTRNGVIENVGYVTTMNDIIVLTVDEEKVGFSQIFPGGKWRK